MTERLDHTLANSSRRSRVPRRTPRACKQCRSSKVRCSGSLPCERCVRRHEACQFPEDDPKVSVSERYLLDIERRAAARDRGNIHRSPVTPTTPENDRARNAVEHARDVELLFSPQFTLTEGENSTARSFSQYEHGTPENTLNITSDRNRRALTDDEFDGTNTIFTQNPLVQKDTWLKDPRGRYRFMGPTSTWSFCRRTLALVEQRLPEIQAMPRDPFNNDGAAFRLKWTTVANEAVPDVSNLPPTDYAIFLLSTVKFHLGSYFQLIDEDLFIRNTNQLEKDAARVAQHQRLWFAQYLLVLAFGQAFLTHSDSNTSPAGSNFAARAMALIPDVAQLHEEQSLAIEVLALAALYLQSIDMRVAAFQYIGQALRLCYVEGIHREFPDTDSDNHLGIQRSFVWWTVYVLDRQLSALMGAPSSVRDEDITAKIPSQKENSPVAVALTLKIKLSRLMATMMTKEKLGSSFLKNTKAVLQNLAEVSRECEEAFSSQLHSGFPSRLSTSIMLLYHHCIVHATRPLVMCILIAFLPPETLESNRDIHISPPIEMLLKQSMSSACCILNTLHSLDKKNLLEPFLPFDLEFAFSASMILSIVQAILPIFIPDSSWLSVANSIFDSMMRRGNVVAGLRKAELHHLEVLLAPLHRTGSTTTTTTQILPTATQSANWNLAPGESVAADQGDFLFNSADWDSILRMAPDSEQIIDIASQLDFDTEDGISPVIFS
ncbi:hypothetical protein BX600DRAFT_227513 [Xylariales sp. PMI_506]|nr:hypothetical protein BX600DRAFT_227513 [Xylariales sp. PMI_506]